MNLARNDPFLLYHVFQDQYGGWDRDLMTNVNQESIIEESPMCQLLQAIHNRNLKEVMNAIDNGARLSDRGFNALSYAIKKWHYAIEDQQLVVEEAEYQAQLHREDIMLNNAVQDEILRLVESDKNTIDGYTNICFFLITNHSNLITKLGAQKLLEINNKEISKILVDALTKGQSYNSLVL